MSSFPSAADDHLELRAGARPLPDYELVARLGKGGFGEVWKAIGPGRVPVALKFIALDQGAGAVEQRALDLMLEVRHAHLLDLHGHWQRHGHLILAMSLADGTLLDRLGQITAQGQPGLPIDELLTYLEEAAKGLDFLAGKRMQHRDVKPGNLLLVGGSVKVADYGLARALEKSVTDTQGGFTLAYAAPELVNQQVSLKVDQYALAVSYCQLRAGRLPFGGSPQQVMIGHLMHPPDLSMLPEAERPAVARALAKQPEERWPTCLAFVLALKHQTAAAGPPPAAPGAQAADTVALAEPRVPTRSVPVSDRAERPPAAWQRQPTAARAPRGRGWRGVGLTVAALAAVGGGLWAWLPGPRPSVAPTTPQAQGPSPEVRAPVLRLTRLQPPTVALKPGATQAVTVQVGRENCDRNVTITVDGLPEGVTAEAAAIAAGANQGELTLRAGPPAVSVSGLATVHVRAGAAVAERQLLVTVRPEPKLELLALDPVALDAGSQAALTVRVKRSHCPGAIVLQGSDVPGGVRIGRGVIADGEDSGRLEVSADADAGTVDRVVRVDARGTGASASGVFRLRVGPKPPPVKQPPELLAAPFGAVKARAAQQEWAGYLNVEVLKTVDLGGGEQLTLALIPPGRYRRGSPDEDRDAQDGERPQREITITKAFYLGKTEVTRGQFRRFAQARGFKTEAESDGKGAFGYDEGKGVFKRDPRYVWSKAGFSQTDDHPVVNVSWNDATAFVDWLRGRDGGKYELPREAEWEYAARAGTTTKWVSGDDPESLATVGNVADGTARKKFPGWTTISAEDGHVFTAPAVTFRANPFGLFDISGNVWEWCDDWYDKDYYKGSEVRDPKSPFNGDGRVLRGGSWFNEPEYCRVASRDWLAPAGRSSSVGFRVLLRLD